MESEVGRILEACYAEILEDRVPDLDVLCAEAPELRARIERVLMREHEVLNSASSSGSSSGSVTTQTERTPSPRRRVGDFEILEEIGSGGMGKVYRARQSSLQREVALKILREDFSDSDGGRARMQREALVTAALDHENIVPIYATGQDGDRIYIAMRLVRGLPLDRQALPLDPMRTASIGIAVARALQAAHEVGVLHRDVKPANILLERDTPYVVDFGLARLARPTTQLTRGNAAPGTLAYMAPEILRERAPVFDPRVDVYGLGATLYETLCGHPPFRSDVQVRLLREVLYDDPKRLGLPLRHRDLETIVLRALEKSPSDRFPTADAMAQELERYVRGEPILSRPIGAIARLWRRACRKPRTSIATAAAALIVIGLSAFLLRSKLDEQQRYNEDVSRIEAAFAHADLSGAARDLERLRRAEGPSSTSDLARRFAREVELRTLTLALQSSLVHANPKVVEPLVEKLRDDSRPRYRLAISAWTALGPSRSIQLDRDLAERFPRTNRVRQALEMEQDPAVALRDFRADGGATDRLFTAFLLRLHGRPPRIAESELHGIDTSGPEGLAVQFSRAIVFEEIAQERAAFLELGPVFESVHTQPFAACTLARLAASLGYADARSRLLHARTLIGDDAPPYLRIFLASCELQIARDLGDDAAFWNVWRESAPLLDETRGYWMFGADAARYAGDLERARKLLETGIRRLADRPTRSLTLRSLALQVDWLLTPYCEEAEPLEPAVLQRAAPTISDFERRAQELHVEGKRARQRIVEGEALLLMARCARALGKRRKGWNLLDRACREYEMPEALSYFAYLVAYRVLNRHLAGVEDMDAQSGEPLAAACRVAFERARSVQSKAKAGDPAAIAVSDMAAAARFACAFHCAYAEDAVPRALRMLETKQDNGDFFANLAARAIEWGGVPLDLLLEESGDDNSLASRVLNAIEFLEASKLTRDQRRATYRRWMSAMRSSERSRGAVWRETGAALRRALGER